MSEQIDATRNDDVTSPGDTGVGPESKPLYGCITSDYEHKFELEILPWVPIKPKHTSELDSIKEAFVGMSTPLSTTTTYRPQH
jgi:hypothetical protein